MIRNRNQIKVIPKRSGNGVEVWGRNYWLKTGHCRRCENGLGHMPRRRGAGGEKSTGVALQRQRKRWDDEIKSDGGKVKLHRQVRRAENAATRRMVEEEA
jgi:hypothetical protein